jgi:hypothetical protein
MWDESRDRRKERRIQSSAVASRQKRRRDSDGLRRLAWGTEHKLDASYLTTIYRL